MQIKEAKIRFDAGGFKSALVTEAVFVSGFNLTLAGAKVSDNVVITSQRGGDEPRLFKSIDAAAKNAREIGFLKVVVQFSA